jgi:sialate O-acetylesterase
MLVGSLLLSVISHAKVAVPALFSDHAVLQRSEKVPIWGTASPHETVKVGIAGIEAATQADAHGKWKVVLDLRPVDFTPHALIIEGENRLNIADVVVGEVWVASGQSNMEWKMESTPEIQQEVALPENPGIRVFKVKKAARPELSAVVEGDWQIASPTSIPSFTAVGYYFAKFIQPEIKAPVGIIHSSWGGSPIEAWTSMDSLAKHPELGPRSAAEMKNQFYEFGSLKKAFSKNYRAWAKKNGREDEPQGKPEDYTGDESTQGSWKTAKMPGLLADSGLPDSGAFWLKTKVRVPAALDSVQQPVSLGKVSGFFRVYWNGTLIKEVTPESGAEEDTWIFINGSMIKAGESTLAIRIFNPGSRTGLQGPPPRFAGATPIGGEWQVFIERALPPIDAEMLKDMPVAPMAPRSEQNTSTFLYNGMINPLIPYAIQGAIWYQGEANTGRAWEYRTAFPLLIEDWRAHWGQGDFPFYFCQLPNNGPKTSDPGFNGGWPELREAQSLALSIPNTGQAVLLDQGEQDDIHPRNKKEVGYRLAQVALAKTYQKPREFSGPIYQSMKIEKDKIRLNFSHAETGLVARELPTNYRPRSTLPATVELKRNSPSSELEGFAICGEDKKWVWADAKIEGDSVVVWSPQVPSPVAVRFAWSPNPTFNLYNNAGFPAAPFRTDDHPLSTMGKKY